MRNSTPSHASIEESLEALRRGINEATVNLAASSMLSEEVTQAMLWFLQTAVHQAHAAISEHTFPQVEDDAASSGILQGRWTDEDRILVKTLQLQGTVVQMVNPVVFSHPFVVAPLDYSFETSAEAQAYLACFSAVGIYNLALARHTQSYDKTRSCEERSRLLQEALAFYHQAQEIMDDTQGLSPEGTLVNVYLASCNNLAEGYLAKASPEESKEWQDNMNACLFAVPPAERSPIYRHFANAHLSYTMELM